MIKVHFKTPSFKQAYNPNVYNGYTQPQPQYYNAQNINPSMTSVNSGNQNFSNEKLIGMGLAALGVALVGYLAFKGRKGNSLPDEFKKLSADEINFLKDKIDSVSVNDLLYREELAKGLAEYLNFDGKIDSYRFANVIGADELKDILGKLSAENFSVGGKGFQNVLNGTFRANLHVHSDYSDGTMTIETILDQAAKYADKVHSKTGENFILALTDHDFTESSKVAVKLIAQNPVKYKNLKFVVGMEKSFVSPSPNSPTGNPTEISELIAYSINPFSPNLNQFINKLQDARKSTAKLIIDKANAMFPSAALSLEDAKLTDASHAKGISMDVQWTLYNYLNKKIPNEETSIKKLCLEYRPAVKDGEIAFDKGHRTENTMKESVDIIKESGYGFLGIAHPGYLKEKGFSSPEAVINEFKKLGGERAYAAEIYYEYKNGPDKKTIDEINAVCRRENLIPTAGIDNHSDSIFTRHLD